VIRLRSTSLSSCNRTPALAATLWAGTQRTPHFGGERDFPHAENLFRFHKSYVKPWGGDPPQTSPKELVNGREQLRRSFFSAPSLSFCCYFKPLRCASATEATYAPLSGGRPCDQIRTFSIDSCYLYIGNL